MLGRRASFDVMSITHDETRSMKASAAVAKSCVISNQRLARQDHEMFRQVHTASEPVDIAAYI